MRKLLIFMVLVLFLIQAPLSLQEEEKGDTILMNGQEILISGQQMSHESQQAMYLRIVAVERKVGVLTATLEQLTKKVTVQHKEEQKLLKACETNQQRLLSYHKYLKIDRKTEARDIKIAVQEMARLLKEFKEMYEKK